MDIFFIGIILLFLSGFISALFNEKYKIIVLSILNVIASLLCIIPSISVLLTTQNLNVIFEFNKFFGAVNFKIDMLSAFFIIIISIISTISVIYSKGYLQNYIDKGKNINSHLIFLPILTASMLSVVTCQNAIMFLICWEIMSLSSFFLVIFENEKKDVLKAGIKYLVFMHVSVIFIMLAFAILSNETQSFDFSTFANILKQNEHLKNIIFILFFIGFGTKAGFVPFHNWLPDAHPAAPSHVSGVMSGVMIKTGIYGILRILTLSGTPTKFISYLVLIVSLMTALYGIMYAITQNDIKKLLAYSSIENIGIIGTGIGIGMLGLAYSQPIIAILGFSGAVLHIVNHSTFKELLFLSAGSVYTKMHTRDMETMGGLIKSMPQSGLLFLIASVAICGLPPLNGFISEFLIYLGMFNSLSVHNFAMLLVMLFAIACIALVGTMAILCFTKAFSVMFLGIPRSQTALDIKNDNGISMILPMILLAVFIFLIGIFPDYAFSLILRPVSIILGGLQFEASKLINVFVIIKIVAVFSAGLIFAIAAASLLKIKATKNKISLHQTWGCGYNKPNNHMQYSASSYVSPFLSMLTPLFKKVFDIEKPRKLFPENSHFNLQIEDIEEAYIINPIVKSNEWFLSKFETLQSGNIQSYIKYGLIFLIIVLIGSLFIGK